MRLRALGFVPTFVLGVLAYAPSAAAQTAPTANAGADQTVAEGATVTLDGSGSSDSANRALTYAWSQTSGVEVELSSTGAVCPSFLAPTQLAATATLTFSLTVTAGGTASQPDTVAIAVTGTPRLGLGIGSRTWQAAGELNTANAQIVVFRYRVQADDVDTDGVAIGANALTLNGGSIVAAIDGTTNAVLTHDAVAADATRKVGRPPPPPAPVDRQPFFTAAVAEQIYEVDVPVGVTLPAAVGGDGVPSYTLTPVLPAGLTYTRPADTTTGGTIAGTPTAAQAETTYTLTATDEDGDTAALAFPVEVARLVVSVADASVEEGAAAELVVTLSETVAAPMMLRWWTEDGTAAAGEDYQAVAAGTLAIVPGRREGTVTVRTVNDRRVEAEETFTVWVTGTANGEVSGATAAGRIADDDAETARRRALGMVLAGGRSHAGGGYGGRDRRTVATPDIGTAGRVRRARVAAAARSGNRALAARRGRWAWRSARRWVGAGSTCRSARRGVC